MILYSRWCALPLPIRHKIAEIFGIPKKGATEVSSNEIKFDGYFVQDIESLITLESIQKYLNRGFEGETLEDAWLSLLHSVEGKEVKTTGSGTETAPVPKLETLPAEEAEKFKKEHEARTDKPTVNKKVTTIKTTVKKTKNAKTKN